MATLEEVRERLGAAGLLVEERQLNDTHVQLEVSGLDAVVNVWTSTGTCTVQGRDQASLEPVLEGLLGRGRKRAPRVVSAASSVAPSGARRVFVVYGHDTTALAEVEAMLRRWGLEPQILGQLPSQGNTIIEKLEHYQQDVGWAVVLLTPDDLGHPALDPSSSAPRPRQNVVLEMGMLLGKLGRGRVAMLYKKSTPEMELPSDIRGYIYIPYSTHVQETAQELAREMAAGGFYDVPHTKM